MGSDIRRSVVASNPVIAQRFNAGMRGRRRGKNPVRDGRKRSIVPDGARTIGGIFPAFKTLGYCRNPSSVETDGPFTAGTDVRSPGAALPGFCVLRSASMKMKGSGGAAQNQLRALSCLAHPGHPQLEQRSRS